MNVRIAKSIKMPTLNSYFVSRFTDSALEVLKKRKPFTIYHRADMEYEITREVYEEIKTPHDVVIDMTEKFEVFTRTSEERYGYQKDAVDFARKVTDLLINFPQGTGKSRTTMMIIEDREFEKTLLICGQSNLQEEWLRDAKKHDYIDKLNFRIIGGGSQASTAKKVSWILDNKDVRGVDVVNIESLRNADIISAINEVGYEAIVVDEVQSAKGWKAAQTEGLHSIEDVGNQTRIALSGTPVLNDPLEFFSLLKFLRQLKDTARTTYERYYGVWKTDFWGHQVCEDYRNLDELQELLKPILANISKSELKLPKKTRRKIMLEQEKSEELVYLEKVYTMSSVKMKKEGFTSKPQIRSRIQVITSTAECKLNYILDNYKEKKLLVFSQYTEVLKAIQGKLTEAGKRVLLYTGELSMSERLEVLEKWYAGECDILLLSVMGARYGLNLIEANDVVFLEPPQSLAVLEQCEDRTHRIGQENEVTSVLLCWGKGDEDRLNNIIRKQDSIERVYDFL